MAKGILIAAMDFSDVAEDEFHDWYDTEHVPERLRGAGLSQRRALDRHQQPEDLGRDSTISTRSACCTARPISAVGGANGRPGPSG